MNSETKRVILENRLALLREHAERVGRTDGVVRELGKAEGELAQLGQQPEQTPATRS